MKNIIFTILASILVTLIFLIIPNRSNISDLIIIPLIACILLKYCIGDWDKGSIYSWSDVSYFAIIILISILTIKTFKIKKKINV